MNYLNRASRCCLRQNLHSFACFCIITVELLGGDCNEQPRLGTGRVASLAHLETIRKEVEAGWTMQAVYDTYGPKLGITYSQFIRYVSRFVKEKTPGRQEPKHELQIRLTT
jgi:hypothetical protein